MHLGVWTLIHWDHLTIERTRVVDGEERVNQNKVLAPACVLKWYTAPSSYPAEKAQSLFKGEHFREHIGELAISHTDTIPNLCIHLSPTQAAILQQLHHAILQLQLAMWLIRWQACPFAFSYSTQLLRRSFSRISRKAFLLLRCSSESQAPRTHTCS